MAKSSGGSFVMKLYDAVKKIDMNGTKVPDGEPPSEVKTNAAVSAWHDRHKAIAEYMVASTIAKAADAREKSAKVVVCKLLQLDDDFKRIPGDTRTFAYDNVSLTYKVTNGRRQINRAKLISAMAQRGVKPESITAILNDAEEDTKPPLGLTATTTVS